MPIREKPKKFGTRVKNSAVRIPRTAKDAARNLNTAAENIQERRYDTSEQYAEAQVEQAGRRLAHTGQAVAQRAVGYGMKRGRDAFVRSLKRSARRMRANRPSQQAAPSQHASPSQPASPQAASNTPPQSSPAGSSGNGIRTRPGHTVQGGPPAQGGPPHGGLPHSSGGATNPQAIRQLHIRYRTGYATRNMPAPTSPASPAQAATRHAQQVQQAAHARRSAMRQQGTSSPAKAALNGQKNLRATNQARSSVRSIKRGKNLIKSGGKTVKTAKRTVKTAQRTIKTAGKAAQAVKRAAQAAKQLAIQAAKAAQAVAKAAVKLITLALKALIAAVQALVAAIAAGGWVAVVAIIIVAAIVAVLISAFGIFFTDEVSDNAYTINEATAIVEADVRVKMQEVADGAGADRVVVDQDGDGGIIQNWRDVLAVYAVKMTTDPENGMAVITITEEHVEKLKAIALDMSRIDYHVETVTTKNTTENADGTTTETNVTEKVLYMAVVGKDARTQAQEYGFTPQQMELLEELLSPDYRAFFTSMLGHEPANRPSSEALDIIYHNLPEGELGAEIVKLALSRLGDEYDYGHGAGGGPGSKVDCSAFTQWIFGEFDISIPRTAAAQGKYCVDNGLTIAFADLVPGDLIFFSHDTNNRFMDITHVAIYAGDGMVVDSSSSKGEVVYRKLYSGQVLYGRAHVAP